MANCEDLVLLLVSCIFITDFKASAQSSQHPDQTNPDNIQREISLFEKEIATLKDVINNASWSVGNFRAALDRIVGNNETTINTSSSNTSTNMADVLAEYFKNPMIAEIKFSNGSSIISGSNAIVDQEKSSTNRVIKSCQEAQISGTYILNFNGTDHMTVYCDADFEAGGWVVIQRRVVGTVDFYQPWAQYKQGFGNLEGEFWFGNDKIHQLTKNNPREINFVMTDWDDRMAVAKYSSFEIGSEQQKYLLKSVGIYSGTAGDSFTWHSYKYFSTYDQDNAKAQNNCAVSGHGAWWYYRCWRCNLNGKYVKGFEKKHDSMAWSGFMGIQYGLKTSKILIRV
ncbi:ficolin-2-like [Malaya genurostris]|uniref:ficolin-2-like n=1 Tax=Malaya genurostris TaxID=325434 RepID=UPI0026F3C1A8|nr:ficolin-2-like [Malaya genurostris]